MTGYNTYVRTDIQTSDPRAVIVLLYEGAINFMNQAAVAARSDQRLEMSHYINKAQKIIQYLVTSLDFEQGEDVAVNLDRLYSYMRDTLNEANIGCLPEKIDEVISLFRTLLEAWREIASDPEATAALEDRGDRLSTMAPATVSRNVASAPPTGHDLAASKAEGNSDGVLPKVAAPAPGSYAAAARSAYGLRSST